MRRPSGIGDHAACCLGEVAELKDGRYRLSVDSTRTSADPHDVPWSSPEDGAP